MLRNDTSLDVNFSTNLAMAACCKRWKHAE